jgi:hypothetical protein
MKRLLFLFAAILMTVLPLSGQKLVIGDRAPLLKLQWLDGTPKTDGKYTMVEFFHSSNGASVNRLPALHRLAVAAGSKLAVVVVTREQGDNIRTMLTERNPAYFAAFDPDGATFSAYRANYVPYSVIYDRKGRIVWLGNPTSLSNDDIMEMLK